MPMRWEGAAGSLYFWVVEQSTPTTGSNLRTRRNVMNRFQTLCLGSLLALVLAVPVPSGAAPAPPASDARLAASASSLFAQAVQGACADCQLGSVERRVLTGSIAEYSFPVRVGAGEREVIRL